MTEFLPEHPGGAGIILRYAGKDATDEFTPIHSKDALLELAPEKHLGEVDPASLAEAAPATVTVSKEKQKALENEKLPLWALLSLADFEREAAKVLPAKAWSYYNSAADDMFTFAANKQAWNSVPLRPRVMRDMLNIDLRTSFLGTESSLPIFIAPAAAAKLAHPEGEMALARAAGRQGIVQVVSSNASCSVEEIAGARVNENQPLFYQLYVNRDRAKTIKLLERVRACGFTSLWVTVDNATAGKRETDERYKINLDLEAMAAGIENNAAEEQGLGKTLGSYIDERLCWDDIKFLKKHLDVPLVLKGIQTAEDARLAYEYGCAGICVSNHGGRQLDTAPSSLSVLVELRLNCPEIFTKMDVFVDGGLRRGTDVLKALCLGCKAVGLGRPPLYSLVYGSEGVEKMLQILTEECTIAMRLIGANSIADLGPHFVNTRALEQVAARVDLSAKL